MIDFFSPLMIVIYALLYGITMKIADLLDEHGLKWFKGDKILFGFLFAGFGVLTMFGNNQIANIILAMVVCQIIRGRLDYLNHQIAATVLIIGFFFVGVINIKLFIVFYFVFLIFGLLRDYVGDKLKKKTTLLIIYENIMWYYPIPTLIYCNLYGNWIIFIALSVFTAGYALTKYAYKLRGYY